MNKYEIRQQVMDAMTDEADNGVWSSSWLEKDSFIFCTRDAAINTQLEGRVRGVVQILKARGDVKIEPYVEEGQTDNGDYIKVTITPRKC